jgi:4-amino-4-deoxy-L-arabinose transferase-like glycosyltransferase
VTRTRLLVGALLVLALGIRVWRLEATSYRPANDAASYLALAAQVSRTGDYSNSHAPGTGAGASIGPTAYFPPAFPYLLAALDVLDGHKTPAGPAVQPARVLDAVLGTATVALIGLVALEAFGEAVALIALGIAAIYPVFIELSGTVYSENLLIPLSLAAVWAGLRAARSERPYRWLAAAGVLGGLATLTHQTGVAVVVALLGLAWSARRTLAAPAVVLGVAVLTVLPWTIRNAIVLHSFVPVSDETGLTLAGTFNPTSAHDPQIPYRWRYYKAVPSDAGLYRDARHLTEPELSSKLEHTALHYIAHHPTAVLAVAYHNTRRLLELEGSFAWRTSAYNIGISGGTAKIGVLSFWLVLLLAVTGASTRLARRAPRWLWAVPILFYLSIVFVNGETPRFRAPIDPFLIMLAGCALATALARIRDQLAVRQSGLTSSVRA